MRKEDLEKATELQNRIAVQHAVIDNIIHMKTAVGSYIEDKLPFNVGFALPNTGMCVKRCFVDPYDFQKFLEEQLEKASHKLAKLEIEFIDL